MPLVVRHDRHDRSHLTTIGAAGFYNLNCIFKVPGFYERLQCLVNVLAALLFTLTTATGVKDAFGRVIKVFGHRCVSLKKVPVTN